MLNLDELFNLFEQIEPKLNVLEEQQTKVVPIELFSVEITEKLGETENSPSREELEKMIANATGISGPGQVVKKLKALQKAVTIYQKENDVSKLMAQVTVLSSMYKMLSSFQPSPAGFLNEAFMSVFYGTEQKKINPEGDDETGGTEIADVYTHSSEMGLPVSIKTIKVGAPVGGSKKLLLEALQKNKKVLFHIYEKRGDPKAPQSLAFYEFVITKNNFKDVTNREFVLEEAKGRKINPLKFIQELEAIESGRERFNTLKLEVDSGDFPKKYDWSDLQTHKTFTNRIRKMFPNAPQTLKSIEKLIKVEKQRLQKKKADEPSFELKYEQWKQLAGRPKAILSLDPAQTNAMVENKIKILNKSIVDLALRIKDLSSNLKNYCFTQDPEKVQYGEKAVEASKGVFPETKAAVSSFK